MQLSELQSKKIIDITSGSNIGNIFDINITLDGKIESLMIDHGKNFLSLNKEKEDIILWENITKIGEDVILIKKE